MSGGPTFSVVVPLYNEADGVLALIAAVRSALAEAPSWELVLVDDGSTDATAELVRREAAADDRIRLIPLANNYGQTTALQAGFDHARGAVIVTMDGDLQNDPRDILTLIAKLDEGYDLVAGYRMGRQDAFLTRKVPSWIANFLIRKLTGLPIRDVGCTLKAYRREVLQRITLYADQHRFTPVLAAANSAARITEMPVRHHPRRYGTSKYGLRRIPKVLADLLIMKMIFSFHDRPLTLFGAGAAAAMTLSMVFSVAAIMAFAAPDPERAHAVVYPGMALLCLGLASHLLLLGLVVEMLLRKWLETSSVPTLRELSA